MALFFLALSALLLHYRVHNFIVPDKSDPALTHFDGTKFIPFLFASIDLVFVTALFLSKKTAVYGYLLNGMLVIFATILMTHFSIAEFSAKNVPLEEWLSRSTFADIITAWADFFVGKALYDFYTKPV